MRRKWLSMGNVIVEEVQLVEVLEESMIN